MASVRAESDPVENTREQESDDISEIVTLMEGAGKSSKEAREKLLKLIEQIPDDDENFIGAQVAIVT